MRIHNAQEYEWIKSDVSHGMFRCSSSFEGKGIWCASTVQTFLELELIFCFLDLQEAALNSELTHGS